jgi:molybdate transport system permease protein
LKLQTGASWNIRWENQLWELLVLPFLLFIVLPILAFFTHPSLLDLWINLDQEHIVQAISLNLNTSLVTTLMTLIFGTPVAYLLSQHPIL